MFNFIKNYGKNVTKNSLMMFMLLIFLTSIVLVVGATYAEPTHKITFMEAEGDYFIKECPTDINGKVTQNCIDYIADWCSKWSLNMNPNQSEFVEADDFANITFDKDTTYYCKSMSSSIDREGKTACYVCDDDSGIMKWDNNGESDSECAAGYKKDDSKNFEECKNYACYECSTDNTIMEWKYFSIGDERCPSGYNKTTKTKEECKYVEPEPEPEPEAACYVCKADKNVMKWDVNGKKDGNCSSEYTKTNIPETECVTIKNPPTNDILIFGVWIIGLGAICYSVYYFRKMSLNN